MCNFNEMVFIDVCNAKNDSTDVSISKATIHNKNGVRISFSKDAVKRLGHNVERIVFAASANYRNRLYIYDVKEFNGRYKGFKLTTTGTRKTCTIAAHHTNLDIMKTIGTYQLERDKDNHLYIPLASMI